MKDAEVAYKSQVFLYQKEYFSTRKQLEDVLARISDYKVVQKNKKIELKKEINELQKKTEELLEENTELKLLTASIEQNKLQMKEIFLEKEAENQALIEKIQAFEREIPKTRKSSISISEVSYDNSEFFSKLLLFPEGILFKNRYIQVGISIKLKDSSGIALIYIGNCQNKPISSLETRIESENLEIQINNTVEASPVLPGHQADRIIRFTYANCFETPPKLIIQYGNHKKTLKLPITPLLFFQKSFNPEKTLDFWDSFPEKVTKDIGKTADISSIAKTLIFYPSFSELLLDGQCFLHSQEAILQISLKNSLILIEIRSSSAEILKIVSALVEEALKFNC